MFGRHTLLEGIIFPLNIKSNEFNETQRATQFARNIHREINSILGIYSELIEDIGNIGLV